MTKLVFISGIFNSVHSGHIRLMSFAKRLAPKLIVGIYSDEYNDSSFGRPLSERLIALKMLNLIDDIVVINKDIGKVLNSVKPNFIVKGSEFKGKFNPEEEYVNKSHTCQLLFSPGDMETGPEYEKIDKSDKKYCSHDKQFLKRHDIYLKNLLNIVTRFKDLRVAVIGETIIDDYIDCTALGMSQEDPTIVVKPVDKKRYLGGAAIVAAHAKSLGADVEFFTLLGRDAEASYARAKLKENGIKYKTFYEDFRPTILKTRYRANSSTLLRVTRVEEMPLEASLQKKLISKIKKVLKKTDLLIFSDFNYGLISDEMVGEITQLGNKLGVIIAADSQSSSQIGDISRFHNVDLITPTEREAKLALKGKDIGLTVLCEKLKQICNAKHVVLTMAENGLLIHSDIDEDNWRTDQIEAFNNYPTDVAGAGDSFLTTAALSLAAKASIWEASYIGSVSASIQVSKTGNVPIDQNELKGLLTDETQK